MLLNIYINGTGCKDNDLSYAGRAAFDQLEQYLELKDEAHSVPMIFLGGVAGSGKDYVPPVMRDLHTLENKPMSTVSWLGKIAKATVSFNPEDWACLSKDTAFVFGKVMGTGLSNNCQLILNTLQALANDSLLPEIIFLSGYSRGAINCISVADEIYRVYGQKIKVNLCLVDPVPGPFHNGIDYIGEKVIAPNVLSFTCFYAPDEQRSFYIANDLTRLVFANPTTTITALAIPESDHLSIVRTNGNLDTLAYSRNENTSSIEQTIVGLNPVAWAINKLTFAINGYDYDDGRGPITWDSLFDQQKIVGTGPRKNSIFYQSTALNDGCSLQFNHALSEIRNALDSSPTFNNGEMVTFADHEEENAESRREQIRGIYYSCGNFSDVDNFSAREQVKEINNTILHSGKTKPDSQNYCRLTMKTKGGLTKTLYYSKEQFQQLELIKNTKKKTLSNSLHTAWKITLDQLLARWPDLLQELSIEPSTMTL